MHITTLFRVLDENKAPLWKHHFRKQITILIPFQRPRKSLKIKHMSDTGLHRMPTVSLLWLQGAAMRLQRAPVCGILLASAESPTHRHQRQHRHGPVLQQGCWERLWFLKTTISKKLCSASVPKWAWANMHKALKNTLYYTSTFPQMQPWQINPASWEEEQFFSFLVFMRRSEAPCDFPRHITTTQRKPTEMQAFLLLL